VALTDVVLVAVRQEQFGQLIQYKTAVAKGILIMFSKQMRLINEALAALTLNEKAPPNAGHLFFVAEYYAKDYQYKLAAYAYSKYIKYCPNGKHIQKAKERLERAASNAKIKKSDFETNETAETYEKDDMIFAEGEPAKEFFIIKSGSVKISRVSKSGEILLAILKAGDVFGEMALLESKPRGASAVAHDKCNLMVVNQANFEQMIKTQPQLIAKLTTLLAERIWTSYRQLENTQITDPLNRMYDMLLIQLEKKRINLDNRGSYTFDFGTNELFKMLGFSNGGDGDTLGKMLKSHFVRIVKDKLVVQDVFEFSKHVSFIRRKLEKDKEKELAI
jgi:CRP-like cAMP-binding protein